jgi:hypothetical protein
MDKSIASAGCAEGVSIVVFRSAVFTDFHFVPPYLLPIVMILFLAVVAQVPDKDPDQPQPVRCADQNQIRQCSETALSSCHAITSSLGIHIGNMNFTRERSALMRLLIREDDFYANADG